MHRSRLTEVVRLSRHLRPWITIKCMWGKQFSILCIGALLCLLPPGGRAQAVQAADVDTLARAKEAIKQARWQDAEQAARSYLEVHASSAEGHYLLAFALFHENKPEASLAEYTHAAKLQKPGASDLRWVALDYVLIGDYSDADRWMTQSLQWDSHDGNVWYEMGRIKYQENRFSEAVAAFQRALAGLPRLVKAEDNLGLAYEGLNEPDKAIDAYKQAIAWQSDATQKSEQPLLNLGILYADKGQTADALPLLKQAETIRPNYGKTHGALGKLYLRVGELASAQEEFEKALALDPTSAGLHFQLGQVYRKEGKAELASGEFAEASKIDGSTSSKVH